MHACTWCHFFVYVDGVNGVDQSQKNSMCCAQLQVAECHSGKQKVDSRQACHIDNPRAQFTQFTVSWFKPVPKPGTGSKRRVIKPTTTTATTGTTATTTLQRQDSQTRQTQHARLARHTGQAGGGRAGSIGSNTASTSKPPASTAPQQVQQPHHDRQFTLPVMCEDGFNWIISKGSNMCILGPVTMALMMQTSAMYLTKMTNILQTPYGWP